MIELYKVEIIPCTFLIDKYDGSLVPYSRHQRVQKWDYIFRGDERKRVFAKEIVRQMTDEFERDYPNQSYIVRLYREKGKEISRQIYSGWEEQGWHLYLNCEGTQNEV